MWLIAGLGNPGKEYQQTRHNIGFWVTDYLAEKLDLPIKDNKCQAKTGLGKLGPNKLILVQPQTYMNKSGQALNALLNYYKLTVEKLVVIVDDFSLELGDIRLRRQGSAGGHNGLASIIESLGTIDFKRVRIGIGNPSIGTSHADFVLNKFTREELPIIKQTVEKAGEAIIYFLTNGFEKAMNKYNK